MYVITSYSIHYTKLYDSGAEPANVILRGDTGNYLLLIFGRLRVEQAVAAGRLTVEGSLDEAKTFNAWFPGF